MQLTKSRFFLVFNLTVEWPPRDVDVQNGEENIYDLSAQHIIIDQTFSVQIHEGKWAEHK